MTTKVLPITRAQASALPSREALPTAVPESEAHGERERTAHSSPTTHADETDRPFDTMNTMNTMNAIDTLRTILIAAARAGYSPELVLGDLKDWFGRDANETVAALSEETPGINVEATLVHPVATFQAGTTEATLDFLLDERAAALLTQSERPYPFRLTDALLGIDFDGLTTPARYDATDTAPDAHDVSEVVTSVSAAPEREAVISAPSAVSAVSPGTVETFAPDHPHRETPRPRASDAGGFERVLATFSRRLLEEGFLFDLSDDESRQERPPEAAGHSTPLTASPDMDNPGEAVVGADATKACAATRSPDDAHNLNTARTARPAIQGNAARSPFGEKERALLWAEIGVGFLDTPEGLRVGRNRLERARAAETAFAWHLREKGGRAALKDDATMLVTALSTADTQTFLKSLVAAGEKLTIPVSQDILIELLLAAKGKRVRLPAITDARAGAGLLAHLAVELTGGERHIYFLANTNRLRKAIDFKPGDRAAILIECAH